MAALPQIFPVGEYFSYSNSGVDLLGRVIEVITGQTYEAAATELVLAPLGMTASTYFAEAVMTRAFAVGHTASPEAPDGPPVTVPEWAIPRASNPAGGLISNLPDQVRYLRFHLGDGEAEGGRVLQPETMRRMQEPLGPGGTLGPVVLDGFGVLWMLSTVGGLRVVEHGGSTNGQQSAFMLVPERRFGVTVLTNADSGAALGEEVKDWLLERALDAPRVMPSPAPYPAGTREEYAGTYDFGPEQQAVVSVDGDALSLAVVGQELRLDRVGEDVVSGTLLGSPFLFDFVRDDTGQVAWFRVSGRMAPKAR
jgi:CubicO group peptidase (beta-lactamase class C family)